MSGQWQPSAQASAVLEQLGWDLEARLNHRPPCSQRDAAIVETLLLHDVSLDELGRAFGLTRERIRQVLTQHTGLSTRDLADFRSRAREDQRLAQGRTRLKALAAEDPTASVQQLARLSGLRSAEVVAALGTEEVLRRRDSNTWRARSADDDILVELRRVAALPGGTPLSGSFYDKHRRSGALSSVRIIQRFQSWTTACAAAGVTARQAPRAVYARKWSRTDLMTWVLRFIDDVGPGASYAAFSRWLREHKDEGAPSAQTVRNVVGTWTEILAAAAEHRP